MNKLLLTAISVCLLAASSLSLADNRRDSGGNHNNSWSSDRGGQFRNDNRRNDNRRNNDRRDDNRHVESRSRVTVNLQFGNVRGSRWAPYYREPVRSRSFGYEPFSNFGYSSYSYPRSTVIWGGPARQSAIINNTYVQPARTTSTVITRSAAPVGSSLLRDIEGRCFEREIDSYGNETRTELPASACNF